MTLHAEITRQPQVVRHALERNRVPLARIARQLGQADFDYVLIAARGSSDNAARYAKYLWASHNRIPVALATPSLFSRYRRPPSLSGALVVGISQSGESPDLVAVVAEGRRQGRPTLVITNRPGSPLARKAGMVIDIRAGRERAVPATTTYTAQLLAIAMLSVALDPDHRQGDLTDTAGYIESVLAEEQTIADIAAGFGDMHACAVLGRGYNLSTAYEWALKIQEVTYALAHAYSTADFLHGPIAVVEPGFPILAVAIDGPLFEDILELVRKVTEGTQSRSVVISNREEALEVASHGIPIPKTMPEWMSPMVAIVAGQLFTYHLGKIKGLDTDRPRGLTKVTLTT